MSENKEELVPISSIKGSLKLICFVSAILSTFFIALKYTVYPEVNLTAYLYYFLGTVVSAYAVYFLHK